MKNFKQKMVIKAIILGDIPPFLTLINSKYNFIHANYIDFTNLRILKSRLAYLGL